MSSPAPTVPARNRCQVRVAGAGPTGSPGEWHFKVTLFNRRTTSTERIGPPLRHFFDRRRANHFDRLVFFIHDDVGNAIVCISVTADGINAKARAPRPSYFSIVTRGRAFLSLATPSSVTCVS